MYDQPKFLGAGDSCFAVEFSDSIEMTANIMLQDLRKKLGALNVNGIRDLVPAYRSLSVHHDPVIISRAKLEAMIGDMIPDLSKSAEFSRRVLMMPVVYGGEFGPDMPNVSRHTGLSPDEVIARHTARDYYCYMLGFTPGFGYFGGLDETLETPRLAAPRTVIPAGSVGIAGKQTGVYSIESPGGWQLIGRTPLRLFDPADSIRPTLIEAGDRVRLRSVSREEYEAVKRDADAGRYAAEWVCEETPCPS